MNELVDCPKCDGKMVPLSSVVQTDFGIPTKSSVVPYAEWQCVKCGYSVRT